MEQYLASVNSMTFYGIVAVILGFITIMCFVFLIKSYRAGIKIGMDKKVLKKAITASATFTLLPSISILLLTLLQRISRTFWSSTLTRSPQRSSPKKGGLNYAGHSF